MRNVSNPESSDSDFRAPKFSMRVILVCKTLIDIYDIKGHKLVQLIFKYPIHTVNLPVKF